MDSVTKTVVSPHEEVWKTARGEGRAIVLAPAVVLVTLSGHASIDLFPLMVAKVDAERATGRKVTWFGDYGGMTSFDMEMRSRLANYTKRHRADFTEVSLLVASKAVALGVSVANLMVGGFLKAYTSREKFDLAIAAAVD